MFSSTVRPLIFPVNLHRAALLALAAVVSLGFLRPSAVSQQATEPETTPPRVIHKVDPEYTAEAREAGVVGEVVLDLDIDAKGNVERIRVKQPLDKGLDENAVAAVRKWKFEPATRNREPVAVSVAIAVRFALK